MKKLILIFATAALSLGSFAGNPYDKNPKDPSKFCAEFKDGVLKVIRDGKEMTEDVTLENGTKIHTDATVQKKDGTVTVLKPGECVDVNGKLDLGSDNQGEQEPIHQK
jgi:hypothetical protein